MFQTKNINSLNLSFLSAHFSVLSESLALWMFRSLQSWNMKRRYGIASRASIFKRDYKFLSNLTVLWNTPTLWVGSKYFAIRALENFQTKRWITFGIVNSSVIEYKDQSFVLERNNNPDCKRSKNILLVCQEMFTLKKT